MPVVLVIGMLLSAADPVFRSWFNPPLLLQHLVLIGIGGWLLVGLFRAANASHPTVDLPVAPRLGTTEAVSVLGALCALYAAFVAAQVVALSGGAHHVLVTHGLTYAEYARQGFFQLLAAATLTLIVLLSVRACADRARLSLTLLSEATVALTLGVVIVAIRRLQLYESAYPAALVARTNLQRATHGRPLDIVQTISLGPDAVPTILAETAKLDPRQAGALRVALCNQRTGPAQRAAFNASKHRANRLLTEECRSGT